MSIYKAIKERDVVAIDKLIKEGLDVNIRRDDYDEYLTPLTFAIDKCGHGYESDYDMINIIKILLDAGADPNKEGLHPIQEYKNRKGQEKIGSTPIWNALYYEDGKIKDSEIVKMLLKAGAEIKDDYLTTVMYFALHSNGDYDPSWLIRIFTDAGFKTKPKPKNPIYRDYVGIINNNNFGTTEDLTLTDVVNYDMPLLFLALQYYDSVKEIEIIVEKAEADINELYRGWTPFMYAVIYNKESIVSYLIKKGANLFKNQNQLLKLASENFDNNVLCVVQKHISFIILLLSLNRNKINLSSDLLKRINTY